MFVVVSHSLPRKVSFRELCGICMEVVEHWDDLLAYIMESREGIDIIGHNANNVERDVAADRTLRAQFALLVFIFKISKYSIVGVPWFGGWLYLDYAIGGTKEVLKPCYHWPLWDPRNDGKVGAGAKVLLSGVISWSCCSVLIATKFTRLCNVKAKHQYSFLEDELAGFVFCPMKLVVCIDAIPVREGAWTATWMAWSRLAAENCFSVQVLRTTSESYFSAGIQQAAQQLYVTTRKSIGAVSHQIGRAMSRQLEQYMSVAPFHPMLISHGNQTGYLTVSSVLAVPCRWAERWVLVSYRSWLPNT